MHYARFPERISQVASTGGRLSRSSPTWALASTFLPLPSPVSVFSEAIPPSRFKAHYFMSNVTGGHHFSFKS